LRTLLLAIVLVLPVPSLAALDLSLPEMGDPASQVMTPAQEHELGEQMMEAVRRHMKLLEDPAINAYVEDLGERLATHSDSPGIEYRFFVVDNPHINAFAMPGGFVGINSGLILAADTESELASVVAHEIGHVTQRHLVRRLQQSKVTGWRTAALILAGILIGTQDPEAGSATAISGMASAAQEQLSYSREHEREADRIGMQILGASGFNPAGMPRFFDKLYEESRYSGTPLPFMSTHPLTAERIADTRARSEQMSHDHVFESPEFPLMRERLRALRAESPRKAAEDYRRKLEAGKSDVATNALKYGLAVSLTRTGEYQQAESLLQGLIKNDAEYAAYFLGEAEAELGANNPEKAASICRTGLSLFPGHLALRYRLVEALMASGKAREAVQTASDLVQDHKDRAELWRLRARAASKAGDSAEAALSMGNAYRLEGDLNSALDQVDRVLDMGAADEYQRSRAAALRERWRELRKKQEQAEE
jgi:predicted Zn-dependent protease